MFKVGQWIWGIEVEYSDFESAEISGYLFMAECGDYVICCGEYAHLEGDFDNQLEEMYEESLNDGDVSLKILKKEYVFGTHEEAKDMLRQFIEDQFDSE